MECSLYMCFQIISLMCWIVLSIAMISMGALYKDDCPIQPYIPIYMVVAGVSHLATLILQLLKLACELLSLILESLVVSFSLAWFITGSIWVFSVYNDYRGQCKQSLYLFAFGTLLFEYAVILMAVIFAFATFCYSVATAGRLSYQRIG
ncbi:hypothetical protein FKM82_021328 [Ascaphus truei]